MVRAGRFDGRRGHQLSTHIEARFTGGGYVWRWRTDIPVGAGIFRARFDQSTLYRRPANTPAVKKSGPDYVAGLSEEGRIQRFVLDAMDGKTSNAEVAQRLMMAFPARFADAPQALARVAELSQIFSGAAPIA